MTGQARLISFPPEALPILQERSLKLENKTGQHNMGGWGEPGPAAMTGWVPGEQPRTPLSTQRASPGLRWRRLPSPAPGGSLNQTQQSWGPGPFSHGDPGCKRMLLGDAGACGAQNTGGRQFPTQGRAEVLRDSNRPERISPADSGCQVPTNGFWRIRSHPAWTPLTF